MATVYPKYGMVVTSSFPVFRFTTVKKAYVYYSVSVKREEKIRISEFTLSTHDENQLDHTSERSEAQINTKKQKLLLIVFVCEQHMQTHPVC